MEATSKGSNPDFLRRLFFPSKKDQGEGDLPSGVLHLNDKWFSWLPMYLPGYLDFLP